MAAFIQLLSELSFHYPSQSKLINSAVAGSGAEGAAGAGAGAGGATATAGTAGGGAAT